MVVFAIGGGAEVDRAGRRAAAAARRGDPRRRAVPGRDPRRRRGGLVLDDVRVRAAAHRRRRGRRARPCARARDRRGAPPPPVRAARLQRRAVRDLLDRRRRAADRPHRATCPTRTACSTSSSRYVPALVASAAVFLASTRCSRAPRRRSRAASSPWRMVRGDLLLNTWWTVVLVALVPGILVAADYSLWLLPLIGIPLVAIQLGSRQAVINEHEARHDRVTGLSNREDVARVLEHALHRAGRQGDQVGVLMVGLSRFKEINETLGHRRGDLVLIEVARRLAEVTGPRDVAARLGGDEFALVLSRVDGVAGCVDAAERALAALAAPVMIRGVELDLGAHAGIACHPEHGDDASTRCCATPTSRSSAPRSAHREVVVYSERLRRARGGAADARRRPQPRDRGRRARARLPAAGGARDGAAARGRGARALAAPRARPALAGGVHRARRADRRDPRADAVGGAGGARPGRALARRRARAPRGGQPVGALDHAGAAARSRAILDGRAGRLELEITETVGMVDAEGSLAVLEELTALGIRLSVDDFGTGFSSLAYLKQLPVSAIKIDRSFVMEMDARGERPRDRALDGRPRPPPRDGGRRGGRREPGALRRAARARLPPRPGLRDQPAARRGRARRVGRAARARAA